MTEQTPEQGTTDPMGGAVYQSAPPPDNEGSGRYAVWDRTLERFVGQVHDSKPSAKDAKALTYDGHYAIVEV